jgi:hypothetical protein
MSQSATGRLPKGIQWSLEFMGMVYVAVMFLFLVSPDWPILMINKMAAGFDWPVVMFPTERFWLSLAVTVPGTRAFLAFSAARRPIEARLCVKVLQVSLVLAGLMFAWQFVFNKHSPLYVIGFFTEAVQVAFYFFLGRRLP